MIVSVKILLIGICFSFVAPLDCKLLPNGNYKLKYTFNSESDSQIKIINNTFVQYWNTGDSSKGRINWIYNCMLKLQYFSSPQSDTSGLGKLIFHSFGSPCIELKERKGDTINFRTTYSGNVHVTINEGKLIKLK
jgi:hypothetical protein